jgi:predicted TIM-barrel fold metal-dependent hydrolase
MTSRTDPIYDAHAHLVSDDLERYPRNPVPVSIKDIPKGTPFGPGVMGFPGGMHGEKPNNIKPTAELLHTWMLEENVKGIAAVQKGLIYRTDNSYIVDAANLFPEEMLAVIIIDPMEEGTLDMIRESSKRGAVGIRFFPINVKMDKIAWLSSDQSLEVWSLADELGLIVDIEAPGNDHHLLIPLVEQMADRFPNIKIVLDHVMLPPIKDSNFGLSAQFDGLAARDNVYVKWTSLNMDVAYVNDVPTDAMCRAVVDFFGADKVMWGSDIGTSSGTYKEMIDRAYDSVKLLTKEEQQKVMHDTGHRVFVGSTKR